MICLLQEQPLILGPQDRLGPCLLDVGLSSDSLLHTHGPVLLFEDCSTLSRPSLVQSLSQVLSLVPGIVQSLSHVLHQRGVSRPG